MKISKEGLTRNKGRNSMNNNKIIAEWLGWNRLESPEMSKLSDESDLVWQMPDGTERLLPFWDKYIGGWHGEDGLLKKIEEMGDIFIVYFIDELDADIYGTDDTFHREIFNAMKATPEQLTKALVKTILQFKL